MQRDDIAISVTGHEIYAVTEMTANDRYIIQ